MNKINSTLENIKKIPKIDYEEVFFEACINNLDKVDIYRNAESALIINDNKEAAIYGIVDEEVIKLVQKILENYNLEVLFCPKIEQGILEKFYDKKDIIPRRFYTFQEKINHKYEYNIKRYDKESAKRIAEEIDDDFDYAWKSVDEFCKYGAFGFYIEIDNKIVSTAWSFFPSIKNKEICVITNKNYRKKNLAFEVCLKFIESALDEGRIPHWSADIANIPSNQLALKLGFKPLIDYYWIFY